MFNCTARCSRWDLDLVAKIGAVVKERQLSLQVDDDLWPAICGKLAVLGVDPEKPHVHNKYLHEKTRYPDSAAGAAAKRKSRTLTDPASLLSY
jgi:hypothetical protein